MRVGFIGLGNIGGAMARNLASDGVDLRVYDRYAGRCEEVASAGAGIARDVAQVARESEITFCSLPTSDIVEAVAGEWLAAAAQGSILVDLSTNAPDRVRALGAKLADRGCALLEAPLSGGAPGAQARMLMFMVGGEPDVFARVEPLLARLGRATFHLGPLGLGNTAKLINSLLAFSTTLASLEALSLAVKCGLDLRQIVTVIRTGGAGNFYTNMAVEGIGRRASTPQFALELAAKDARLIRELAQQHGAPAEVALWLDGFFERLVAAGQGQADWTALPDWYEKQAGLKFELAPAEETPKT